MVLKINNKEIGRLLRSQEMADRMKVYGDRIARKAGKDFAADSYRGKTRARSNIWPQSYEAVVASANDHVLLKAIDAGRQQ